MLGLALLVIPVQAASAASGGLDTSFSGDGRVLTNVGAGDNAQDVTSQPDGRVLVAGSSSRPSTFLDFIVARYRSDGTLDSNFSGDGLARAHFGGDDQAFGVARAPGGKIVVAGESISSGVRSFAVARFNANGTPDTTFSGDGRVVTKVGTASSGRSVAVQADGRIVVAGFSGGSQTPSKFALVRYRVDGLLDSTFSGDGKVLTDPGSAGGLGGANDLVLDANGKPVVGGVADISRGPGMGQSRDFVVARYKTDGSPDDDFDSDGLATTNFGGDEDAQGIGVQSDGRIVAAGNKPGGGFALAAYTPSGAPDTAFGSGGRVTTDVGAGERAEDLAVQGDGRLVVGGSATISSARGEDFALVRYTASGSPDSSFSGDGKVFTNFGGDVESANAVAVQPSGRLVAAGLRARGDNDEFAVARYLP